jgi:diguanylate cyclase (GGDEF)-like protein
LRVDRAAIREGIGSRGGEPLPLAAVEENGVSQSPPSPAPEAGAVASTEARTVFGAASQRSDLDDPRTLADRAKRLIEQDPATYLERVDAALAAARAAGQADVEMQLVYYQACAYDIQGRFEDADAAMARAHRLAATLTDLSWQAKTIGGLGGFLVARGDSAGAIDLLEKSLPMYRAANNRLGEAATFNNLGFAYLNMRGLEERAIEFFENARQIWIDEGVRSESALALGNIACAELALADRLGESEAAAARSAAERALATAERAYREADEQTVLRVAIDARIAFVGAATLLGRYAEAFAQLEEAGRQLARNPSVVLQIEMQLVSGRLLRATGRGAEAAARLSEAEQLTIDNNLPVHRTRVLRELSAALELAGDLVGSLRAFRLYHQLGEQLRDRDAERQAQALNGRLAVERAEHAAEVERLRAAWLEEQNRILAEHALEDGLTGLANRRAFDARVGDFLGRGRGGRAVALIDIDHFKSINDRHSHLIGDEVLRRLGALLRAGVRDLDFAARVGGEEFALLFGGVERDRVLAACERLRELVAAQPWSEVSPDLSVTISIGLAMVRPGEDARAALARADQSLYRAKEDGRDRVVAADEDRP